MLYTGQQRETDTGIYHYGARLYNTDIGRFPQADTITPDVGDPQALNRYAYVRNNPTNMTDPTGHMFSWEGSFAGGPTTAGMDFGAAPHPVTKAMTIIGLSSPIEDRDPNDECYAYSAQEYCWATHDAWREMTLWAADYLASIASSLGMLLNDLPWSPSQRVLLGDGSRYGITFRPDARPEHILAMHANIQKLAAVEAAFLPATGGGGPPALGSAFEFIAFAYLRTWGLNTARFTIPSGTKNFRVTDATISIANEIAIIAEFKYASAGRTLYLTRQMQDYFASHYTVLFGYPSHATLSRGLQRMLIERGAIWWTYPSGVVK